MVDSLSMKHSSLTTGLQPFFYLHFNQLQNISRIKLSENITHLIILKHCLSICKTKFYTVKFFSVFFSEINNYFLITIWIRKKRVRNLFTNYVFIERFNFRLTFLISVDSALNQKKRPKREKNPMNKLYCKYVFLNSLYRVRWHAAAANAVGY